MQDQIRLCKPEAFVDLPGIELSQIDDLELTAKNEE